MRRKFLALFGFITGLIGILLTFPATLLSNPLVNEAELPVLEESGQTPTPIPSSEASPSSSPSATVEKTPIPTTSTSSSTSVTRVITGLIYKADKYGDVQIQITLTSGAVTSVKVLKIPDADSRSSSISQMAVPILTFQTIEAKNSSNIQGASGASYTSAAWIQSLQSALSQA
jgi:uncharacterized protein with FMN-binding domain